MSGDTINNHYAARPLDDEEVWLRSWCAVVTGLSSTDRATDSDTICEWADVCLAQFRIRFPRKIEAKNAETI